MAHFAKLDENNIVTQVIVVSNDDCTDPHSGQEDEVLGIAFCKKLLGGNWKQTSYNNSMRGNYAGIGYKYHTNVATLGVGSTDVFLPAQPYASWTIDTTNPVWKSPIGDAPGLTTSQIDAGSVYTWDEAAYQADNTVGWALTTP
tara:strand:+ start:113 stop:544 length:432 start_codon:yes stop_codon:yes gene_type:complete